MFFSVLITPQLISTFLVGLLSSCPAPPVPFTLEEYMALIATTVKDHNESRPYSLLHRLEASNKAVSALKFERLKDTEVKDAREFLESLWKVHLVPPDRRIRITVKGDPSKYGSTVQSLCGDENRVTFLEVRFFLGG
jgi:hypothetical protein